MFTKRLVSIVSSLAMLGSLAIAMPLSAQAEDTVTIFADNFDDRTVEAKTGERGTVFDGDWLFAGYNYDANFSGSIADGVLTRKVPWSTRYSGFKLSSDVTDEIGSTATISGSLFIPAATDYGRHGGASIRFCMSADESSFYEVGFSNTKQDDLVYPELFDQTWGPKNGGDSGSTRAHYFISKVVDGTRVETIWENDPSGFYSQAKTSTSIRQTQGQAPADYVINMTPTGFNISVTAIKKSGSSDKYTWNYEYNDTTLMDNKGVAVVGFNGQQGFTLDNFSITAPADPTKWTDSFNRTVAESENRAGEAFGADWVCAGNYGSYPEWFHREIDGSKFVIYSRVSAKEGGIVISDALKSRVTKSMEYKATIGIPNHGTTTPSSASGAATMRFAISEDGNSFYEIGCSGKKGDNLTYEEFAPKQGTYEWKTFKDTNGNVISGDYGSQYCHYFVRKVVDGVTVPLNDFVQNGTDVHPNILWENDPKSEGGFFAQSPTASSVRGNLGKTTADIVVTTSPEGFTFAITALNSAGQKHTWTRTVADADLLGAGTGLGFFTFNGQHSMFNGDKRAMTLDDVSMKVLAEDEPEPEYTYDLVDYGTIEKNEVREGLFYQVQVNKVDTSLTLGVADVDFTITGLGSFDVTTALTYAILGAKAAVLPVSNDIEVTSGSNVYVVK